jgi:hypothetical protein
MEFPEINSSTQRAISALTELSAENMDPIQYFSNFAKSFGGVLPEDMSYSKPLYPDFEDYDYLHDTSLLKPVYLNDFDLNLEEDRDTLAGLIRMDFKGNTFDTIAQCAPWCGKLRGNYLIGSSKVCTHCGQKAEQFLDKGEQTILWLRPPEGVSGFAHHGFYNSFFKHITLGGGSAGGSKICVPRYFLENNYRAEQRNKSIPAKRVLNMMLEELNIPDNEVHLNTFHLRCDEIMHWIIEGNGAKYFKPPVDQHLYWRMYKKYRHLAFSQFLKVPNRYATVLERKPNTIYGYQYQPATEKLYLAMADTKKSNSVHQLTVIEKRRNIDIVGRSLVRLAEQYAKVNNPNVLFAKPGLNRKHGCSGPIPFTARCVITSQTGLLNSDVLIVPWKVGVAVHNEVLCSQLYRRGYYPTTAIETLHISGYKVVPIIDELFKAAEDAHKILVQAGRNPSIEYLSLRTFFCKFNRDLTDESIKIPIPTVGEYNA